MGIVYDTPPESILAICDTPDRVEHWKQVKARYSLLYAALQTYFTGEVSPLQDLPDSEQELAMAHRDDYLALYALIHDGWKYISPELEKIKSERGVLKEVKTPGGLFHRIFIDESFWDFCQAFRGEVGMNDWYEFSPGSRRKNYYQNSKDHLLSSSSASKTKPEQAKLARYKKRLEKQVNEDKGRLLRYWCTGLIQKKAKSQKNPLYRKLKEYEQRNSEFNALIIKSMHHRYIPNSYSWSRGKKVLRNK